VKSESRSLTFQLDCSTDASLYDQPLTLEAVLPQGWDAAVTTIRSEAGTAVPAQAEGGRLLRFEVPPQRVTYIISTTP
jgi:hypothetical protein